MPNIRLKAATEGGLALDVLARTASSTHPVVGIGFTAEPQNSEIALAADPIITQNVYRVSANALSHEIYMTYEAIPVVNLPAENILTSDSIGPFVIGFNPTDTPIMIDAPAFDFTFNSIPNEVFSVTDLPAFELGRPLADSFSTSDSIGPFTVGSVLTDSFSTSDSIGPFTVGSVLTDSFSLTDLPAFTVGSNPSDSATMSDSIGPFAIGSALTDSFSLTDTPQFDVAFNLSDSFNLTDLPAFTVGFTATTDSFSLTDAPVFDVGFNPTDKPIITDAPVFDATTNLSDSFSMSDVLTPTMLFNREFTDSVSMLDQFASTVVKPIDTNLSTAAVDPDPVIMSDVPAMTFGLNSLSDSASATDLPELTVAKGFSDSVTPSDSPVLNIGLNSLSDNFTVADVPTFTATKGFSDFPHATDAPVLNIGLNGLSDSVSVSQNIVLQPVKTVVDN